MAPTPKGTNDTLVQIVSSDGKPTGAYVPVRAIHRIWYKYCAHHPTHNCQICFRDGDAEDRYLHVSHCNDEAGCRAKFLEVAEAIGYKDVVKHVP